jgi:hypothetical protein
MKFTILVMAAVAFLYGAVRPMRTPAYTAKTSTLQGARPRQNVSTGIPATTTPTAPPRTPNVSLFAILADPGRFHGREIEIEGVVSYGHSQFVLAPDPFNMTYSTGANLICLDVSECNRKEELQKHGNPAVCYLRGVVDSNDFGPNEYPPKSCTFHAHDCRLVVHIAKEK